MSVGLFLMNCKGADGAVGPAGATGATGTTGATGATGATGSANVIYSDWVTIPLTGTISSTSVTTVQTPKITQEILDRGGIFSYIKFTPSNFVYSLPLVFPISGNGSANNFIAVRHVVGTTTITSNYSTTGVFFRYVVVPGGIAGGRKAAIDYTDYEAVKAYYNLPD